MGTFCWCVVLAGNRTFERLRAAAELAAAEARNFNRRCTQRTQMDRADWLSRCASRWVFSAPACRLTPICCAAGKFDCLRRCWHARPGVALWIGSPRSIRVLCVHLRFQLLCRMPPQTGRVGGKTNSTRRCPTGQAVVCMQLRFSTRRKREGHGGPRSSWCMRLPRLKHGSHLLNPVSEPRQVPGTRTPWRSVILALSPW